MHLVYGIDSKYVIPALISFNSALENASNPIKATFYIDQVADRERRLIEKVNSVIDDLISLSILDNTDFEEFKQRGKFTKPSLLPLSLPKLIKEKCLFVDADTLILGDICELYSTNMDKPIGACIDISYVNDAWKNRLLKTRLSDFFYPSYSKHKKLKLLNRIMSLGFDPSKGYFNSGVMLMDCQKIRDNFPHYLNLTNVAKLEPYFDGLPDQDRLNDFFHGNWYPLPLKWNVRPRIGRDVAYIKKNNPDRFHSDILEAAKNPKLWHYMGRKKPWIKKWKALLILKNQRAYQDYFSAMKHFQAKFNISLEDYLH